MDLPKIDDFSHLVSAVKVLQVLWFWCQEGQAGLRSGVQDRRHFFLSMEKDKGKQINTFSIHPFSIALDFSGVKVELETIPADIG